MWMTKMFVATSHEEAMGQWKCDEPATSFIAEFTQRRGQVVAGYFVARWSEPWEELMIDWEPRRPIDPPFTVAPTWVLWRTLDAEGNEVKAS